MLQDRRALTWDLYHQVVAISAGGWLARSKLVLTMTMRRSSSRSASHLPASGDFRPLRLRGEGGRSRALRTAASQRLLRELERPGSRLSRPLRAGDRSQRSPAPGHALGAWRISFERPCAGRLVKLVDSSESPESSGSVPRSAALPRQAPTNRGCTRVEVRRKRA
jgi:hypothetical protein